MVHKSRIDVVNLTSTQPSNCQLIIKGIEPQQQVNLCTGHYTNLSLIDTVDPLSSQLSDVVLASAGPGELSAHNKMLV